MLLRFLRSVSLLALLAMLFAACANNNEGSEEYGEYEDSPLDASALSPSSRRGARAYVAREPVAKATADGSIPAPPPVASTDVVVTAARDAGTSVAAGGAGIRGGRASETAIRVDGIATTEILGTVAGADVAAYSTTAEGTGMASAPLSFKSIDVAEIAVGAVTTSEVMAVTVAGDDMVADEVLSFDITAEDVVEGVVAPDDSRSVDADKAKKVEEDAKKPKPEPIPIAGQLTAGEWSDLSDWNFWTALGASKDWNHMNEHWGLGNGRRISVRVDNGRDPIPDAVAQLLDKNGSLLWTARTDNFGRAELFTGLQKNEGNAPYQIVVTSGEKETRLGGIDPSREQSPSESPLTVRLAGAAPVLKVVDLMFVVDATGSMGDELNYIQAELQNVIERVQAEMEEEFVIRLSTNVYRDRGDEYVVRSHEFTEKIEEAAEFLRNQVAGGGGDTPEAVEEALEDGIRGHAWSEVAQSRFLFMLLDAPPHYSEDRLVKLQELTREAASKGIRIIGVSGSGVDKETEFLLRNMGIHTGGTYVFLTDHSGIGGSHIEPTIGSYQVEYLNDLLVRLIVQYTKRPASVDAITPRKPDLD